MDDEIREVKTCLSEILKQESVTNKDLARAVDSFMSKCYIPHVEITRNNSKKVDHITRMVEPIAEWVKPKIEKERRWKEDKRKVIVHVICWGLPMLLLWSVSTFGGGFRALVKQWLAGS